jgi:hypothetical protein
MHAGAGPIRCAQTCASMISHLPIIVPSSSSSLSVSMECTHWMTATSSPCVSIYKPVWCDDGTSVFNPSTGSSPSSTFVDDRGRSIWWKHEIFHRLVLLDYERRMALVRPSRDALQAKLIDEARDFVIRFTSDMKDQARPDGMLEWAAIASRISLHTQNAFKQVDSWTSDMISTVSTSPWSWQQPSGSSSSSVSSVHTSFIEAGLWRGWHANAWRSRHQRHPYIRNLIPYPT